jgi:uncharacterized protein (TIGR03086 family)
MDAATMAAACASTERYMKEVTDDQLELSTPCEDWDVRALLNHVIGTLALGRALLSDTAPETPMQPGGLPDADLVGDDPLASYQAGVDALIAAATDDAWRGLHPTPLGEMPGVMLGGFTTLDIAVHGWDLAIATGQDPTLDEQLATAVMGFARRAITPDTRAPRIGPEVAVKSTSITDQLVGFLGRTP